MGKRPSKQTRPRQKDDFIEILIEQIKFCSDGRELARYHLQADRECLVWGVTVATGRCQTHIAEIEPTESVLDYLELGYQLLGFETYAGLVRVDLDALAATIGNREVIRAMLEGSPENANAYNLLLKD